MAKVRVWRLLFFSISFGMLLYSATFVVKNYLRYQRFHREYVYNMNELKRLKKENSDYIAHMERIKDDAYWILEAKRKLGYIQPGEVVYKFYD